MTGPLAGLGRFGAAVRLRRTRSRREALIFLAFVAPNAALFLTFTYWPMLCTLYLSFTEGGLLPGQIRWAGLDNYVELVSDAAFRRVCINTVLYALVVVGVAQALAFLFAHLLNTPIRGRAVFRTLAFTPHITTPAAAALAWVLLLDPDYGPLGTLYGALGVQGPHWLRDGLLALGALMFVGAWKELGFASVFFLAGLQGLPRDCYEAAEIDGASRWATLRHLTLPLMSPVVFFLLVSGLVAAMRAFDVVAVMSEGGPVYPDSSLYVYHLYTVAFRRFDVGSAAAIAMVFFVVMLLITVVQLRAARRWVHYDGA